MTWGRSRSANRKIRHTCDETATDMCEVLPPAPPPGVGERFEALMADMSPHECTDMLVSILMSAKCGDHRHPMVLALEWAESGRRSIVGYHRNRSKGRVIR